MSAFVLTVIILYGLGMLANLFNLVTLAKAGKSVGAQVFGIIVSVGMIAWGIALLTR